MTSTTMRDAFFDRLYQLAWNDRRIMVVAADMGAPSLDKFRRDLSTQFLNVGIAEQTMVTIATGLALSGKKVYTYAIMPFATLRCYEAIKVNIALMNIAVTIVGVGTGFSYDDSGPTHHSTEDLSVMRALPNMTIYCPSDSLMAARFADLTYNLNSPCYVRLDRKVLPAVDRKDYDLSSGYRFLLNGENGCLLATGNMAPQALKVARKLHQAGIRVSVVDIFRLKPLQEKAFVEIAKKAGWVATLEEHLLAGGLGSAIIELLTDHQLRVPVKRFGVEDRYLYEYGGRNHIQNMCGLSPEVITMEIKKWVKDLRF
ncbi:MAG: 1-deoxy-D-xylulose-5-phosphate synthase [Candidatus Omnitrophica bacterium]|nr:1-deoxy-D-xylulose-5-phosphate synthase [Candidatus Omnitrophota bacterium]